MKKFISILTVLIIVFNFAYLPDMQRVSAISFQPAENVYSDSIILYNTDTKTVVYEKKADEKCAPAQLVQIMTAIVAMEKADSLQTVIEVPSNIFDEFYAYEEKYPEDQFPYNEVTTCYLEAGEQLKIEHFIYAMLLESSCEAASTLAYRLGEGSIQNFVNMMNEKAKEIGAVNTHFTNPHGLYDEEQYSTARDILLITEYALTVPGFAEIAQQARISTGGTNIHPDGIIMENVNPMLHENSSYYYPGAKGIKTGNSNQSGRCLVARASNNGSNYIAVLLNAPLEINGESEFTHLEDAEKLFDWAFEFISHQVVLQSTEEIVTVKVNYAKGKDTINLKPANDVKCMWLTTLDTSSINRTDIEYVYEELNAPVKAGEKLGTLTLRYLNNEIAQVDLVAYSDAELSYIKYSMAVLESYLSSGALKKALKTATLISLLYMIFVIYLINRRAKKRRESRMSNTQHK